MFFLIWFISRIFVLTGNYKFSINPTFIQVGYIFGIITLLLIQCKCVIKIEYSKYRNFFKISFLLLIHTILWGTIFTNPLMEELTSVHFKPQLMFVVIVILTACAVIKFDAFEMIIKLSFYAISIVLIIQLLSNFSELNLSNLANIMDKSARTRANFGFGHYNALGGVCLCNVILWTMMKKGKIEKFISVIFMSIAIVMLLCSASRSSLTGLILFIAIRIFEKFSNITKSAKQQIVFSFTKIIIFLILLVFALNLDFKEILIQSQRSLLFEYSLPVYWNSGRVLEGLGYVSNTAYGTNLTPYTTYWLDNGYIYILISTGILGFSLIGYVLYILIKKFYFSKNIYVKNVIFPILCVYMYVSLFEANLFNSGSITSYIYIVIFLFYIYKIESESKI